VFSFTGLAAGRFTLSASKPAYLAMAYGAKRPERQGTALTIADGQDLRDIVIRLPRGAVIKGTLRDQNGEPVAGVTINAIKPTVATTASSTLPAAVTDDRGAYRIFGLTPGEYLVAATFRAQGSGAIAVPSTDDVDRAGCVRRPRDNARKLDRHAQRHQGRHELPADVLSGHVEFSNSRTSERCER
jgi:hypothetical protein